MSETDYIHHSSPGPHYCQWCGHHLLNTTGGYQCTSVWCLKPRDATTEADALRAELAALTRKLAEREAEIATIKGQLEYERNNDIYQDDRSDA